MNLGRKEFSHGVSLVLVYIHSKKSSFLSRSLLILHISKMHFHLCFTDQKYLKLELMKTSVNGEYQKRCRSLNQMTFTLHKRSTLLKKWGGKISTMGSLWSRLRICYRVTHPLLICTWFVKNQFGKVWHTWFLVNFKIVFCRLKIQFVELDFSKLIFQNSSTDQQGVNSISNGCCWCKRCSKSICHCCSSKGHFFLLSLSNCLRYSSTGARSRDFGASINFNFHFRMA